jgi:hypothetical protein
MSQLPPTDERPPDTPDHQDAELHQFVLFIVVVVGASLLIAIVAAVGILVGH